MSRLCPTCQIEYDDHVNECPLDGTPLKKIAISPSGEVKEGSLPQEPALDKTTLAPPNDPRLTALAQSPIPEEKRSSATKLQAVSKPSSQKLTAVAAPPSSGKHAAVSAKQPPSSQSGRMPSLVSTPPPPIPTPEEAHALAQKQIAGEEEDETLPPGTRCGEYQIESKIGEGGMGIIYRATHPLIGKQAAVKVLRRELCHSTNVVSRFLVEAMAVNKIRHPNTVDIFSFGQLPDGRHFLIMEFLEGINLEDHLKAKGRLTLSESLVILRPLVSVLSSAHAAGIIHRDLKPENVFLAKNPEGPFRVKLLDFGIAKLMEGHGEISHRTSTGMMMGTPYYMAPEQILGHKNIDARADQYSLGIILFQMLSGELPFSGKSLFDVASKHVQAKVPDLPPMQGRTFSAELFSVIEQALAKRPEARFTDVKEFLSALEAVEPNAFSSDDPNLKMTRAVEMHARAISPTAPRTPKPDSSGSIPAIQRERKMGETVAGQAPRVASKNTGGFGYDSMPETYTPPALSDAPLGQSQLNANLNRSQAESYALRQSQIEASSEIQVALQQNQETPAPAAPPAPPEPRPQPIETKPPAEAKAAAMPQPRVAPVPPAPPTRKTPLWVFAAGALVTGVVIVLFWVLSTSDTEPKPAAPAAVALPELEFAPPAPEGFLRNGVEIPLPKK